MGKKKGKDAFGEFEFEQYSGSIQSMSLPVQMIPAHMKNDLWIRLNVDFLELEGLRQIEKKAPRIIKNNNLAAGILDRSDYIVDEVNEYSDILEMVADEPDNSPEALELKFYPLIPTYYETLLNEFSKIETKIDYRAVDDRSVNEIMDKKSQEIGDVLLEYGQAKLAQAMIDQGADPNSPEFAQALSPENLEGQIQEIDEFYSKTYRSSLERWAARLHEIDYNRLRFEEKERDGFGDLLKTNSEYWHIKMYEDDYDVEVLRPELTFSHQNPMVDWISERLYAGYFEVGTVASVIDSERENLSEEDLEKLISWDPSYSARMAIGDNSHGEMWDNNLSDEENRRYGSDTKKLMAVSQAAGVSLDSSIVDCVLGRNSDLSLMHDTGLVRIGTFYWKSQRKLGLLTEINRFNQTTTKLVDENFKVQLNPIYNNKFSKEKDTTTLVYGQHVDWFWINETWGAKKIGASHSTFSSAFTGDNTDSIYIGIGRKKPGPLKFQFKSNNTLYGSKLPIEGREFGNRGYESRSAIDLLKPAQILFNMANNQINDIMVDEIGPVVVLDHGTLPQHSNGEDWGKHNYAKAYGAMREWQMLPLDGSIANLEAPTGFSHFQRLDLSQTDRLMSRLRISEYAKQMANDVLGFTPQRLGQQIGQTTATGIEQAVVASHNRTDTYFTNHRELLMPRVHEMRTHVAQFYYSTKPSNILRGMINNVERVIMEVHGTDLLLRDLQIFVENSASKNEILEGLKRWAMGLNTLQLSLIDGIELSQVKTLNQLKDVAKSYEERLQKQAQEQHARDMEKIKEQDRLRQLEVDKANNFKALQNMITHQVNLLRDEIKSSGYAAMQDLNKNNQSDQMDLLKTIRDSERYQDTMQLNRDRLNQETSRDSERLAFEREKEQNKLARENMETTQALVNKNQYDKK